jgi:hypothetical protein
MAKSNMEGIALKIIEKIYSELKEIELLATDYIVKERIQGLLELIELETEENKTILTELIQDKIRETKGVNSELNTNFYLLNRKLMGNKISIMEAKATYEMYAKEFINS